MPRDLSAKLLNVSNPKNTGGMHGLLPVHVGMSLRLLSHLDLEQGLVKDAEGEVVHVVVNPADEGLVEAALAAGKPHVYLKHVPVGFWVKMKKFGGAPFGDILEAAVDGLPRSAAESLVFLEPHTSAPFKFRGHVVTRTGFPISHGRVMTSTACQGRTMHTGVVVDCGRHTDGATPKDNDDWWLDLYVMLSRATRLDDLLLIRPPPSDFLLRGPPAGMKQQVERFSARAESCRASAAALAAELGFDTFFH